MQDERVLDGHCSFAWSSEFAQLKAKVYGEAVALLGRSAFACHLPQWVQKKR